MKAFWLASRPGDSDILINSWLWDKRVFRYEPKDRGEQPKWEGGQFDDLILEQVKEYAPDLVVYLSLCPHPNHPLGGIPAAATFHKIRDIAPVVSLCGDGGCDGWRETLLKHDAEDRYDVSITFDGCKDWPLAGRPHCWAAPIPVVFPAEIEVRLLAERPVPVSFCGTTSADNRIGLLATMRSAVGMVAQDRDPSRTWVDYCRSLAQSRVSLNIAWSGSRNVKHVKARVSESGLAGCCLLEQRGAETARWLTPGEDYADYGSPDEAVSVCRRLLADLTKAQGMANRLRAKLLTRYSPRAFWKKVARDLDIRWEEAR